MWCVPAALRCPADAYQQLDDLERVVLDRPSDSGPYRPHHLSREWSTDGTIAKVRPRDVAWMSQQLAEHPCSADAQTQPTLVTQVGQASSDANLASGERFNQIHVRPVGGEQPSVLMWP